MVEGWYYINNKNTFVQTINGVVKGWRPNIGWRKINRWDVIASIIEDLRGTCKSLYEVVEEYGLEFDSLDDHELNEIDQNIFLCDWCGWWYESGEGDEYKEEMLCDHCLEDIEDE